MVIHRDGKITDAEFHDEMINDPAANRAIQQKATAAAIKDGMDQAKAKYLYGYRK